MLRSKQREDPGQYGHHCGGGQFATHEERPEEAPERRPPDPRYGHHCGGGQLAAHEEQPEEAPRR